MAILGDSITRFALWVLAAIVCVSCATHKPCSEAGDTSWPNPMRGDKVCYQKQLPNGKVVDNGRYIQYFPSGKLFLEGNFKEGEKDGYWFQYDEKGKKVLEKYYENGMERMPPTNTSGGSPPASSRQ